MKKLILLSLLLFSVHIGCNAQDVIVKKDGSTVLCRIIEVTSTEAVYKKWQSANDNNYVMNLADITSINYQDGRRWPSGESDGGNAFTPQPNNITTTTELDQINLYKLDKDLHSRKSGPNPKALRIAAWVTAGACLVGGVVMIALSRGDGIYEVLDGNGAIHDLDQPLLMGAGFGVIGVGALTTTILFVKAHKISQKSDWAVNSAPLFEKKIKLGEGSLRPGVDLMSSQINKKPSLGLGLRYSF